MAYTGVPCVIIVVVRRCLVISQTNNTHKRIHPTILPTIIAIIAPIVIPT